MPVLITKKAEPLKPPIRNVTKAMAVAPSKVEESPKEEMVAKRMLTTK